jgi:carotenoid cleavage dioxygenase-like enzyme
MVYRSTHYTVHPAPYTLHTTHYTLHTTHYTLHTTHYALNPSGDLQACKPQLWRWSFNLKTGETEEECLDDTRCLEFGMFNQQYAGKDYRYSYR